MAESGWETFKLSELRLDQKNYRLGEQDSQRAAILEMIGDQAKLANLARDLMDVGPSPGEPVWVTKDPKNKGQYIVLEGNRRVTALKLMETPALADGTVVEKHFRNLSKLYSKKPIRQLEARVFPSWEDAQPWIRRRHMTATSGVGLQRWEPLAKGRADKAHGLKTPRFLSVIELLGDNSDAWNNTYDALDDKWTTVDRVLNTKAMVDTLGVAIDLKKGVVRFENGNTAAGKKLLGRILEKIASPEFEFSDVETVDDREAFVQQFADGAVKAKAKAAAGKTAPTPAKPAPSSPVVVAPRATASKDQDKRPTLAPKTGSRTFKVEEPRLASIYSECKNIKLTKNKNAAALLLRVFIELSSEALLIKKKVPMPKKYSQGKWSDINIRLDYKVSSVANYLDPAKTAKEFKQARMAMEDSHQNAAYSIHTLHAYFHNLGVLPDPAALRSAWDAWEGYLRIVHENLRKP